MDGAVHGSGAHAAAAGLIGGLAGGFVGHKICRAFGSGGGGCTGDALWWAAAAGMRGGLIGATSAEDGDR